jgi:hypothetical protein
VGQLPVACWHVFDPAASLAATQAAVEQLTEPPVSVKSAASAADGAVTAAGEVPAPCDNANEQ